MNAPTYAELVQALSDVQKLRIILLSQHGYEPECVLDYCNQARALLARLDAQPRKREQQTALDL